MKQYFAEKEILITGIGTLGSSLVKYILTHKYKPKGIRLFSRNENKQWQLQNELKQLGIDKNVAFLIGDIRDRKRLEIAMNKVDIVINTSALKHVSICEYNPIEAIETNINGTKNVILAALEKQVEKVMLISTDKSVYSTNLYGMTKAVAEKLFIHGNVYSGGHNPKFSVCRYGNVLGSSGSVIQLFQKQKEKNIVTITNDEMTRFFFPIEKVVKFILDRIEEINGEEIFIPKMPSMKIVDIAKIIAPDCEIEDIGIRKGEKLHECLITIEEGRQTVNKENYYIIYPNGPVLRDLEGFTYVSNLNPWQLKGDDLKEYIKDFI